MPAEREFAESGSYIGGEVHGWFGSSYDKETGTGGSNGATMRFSPEGDHGANAGLKAARDFLEPIKGKPLSPKMLWRFDLSVLVLANTRLRKVPMDLLFRSLDPCRRMCSSRNARSDHSLAARSSGP